MFARLVLCALLLVSAVAHAEDPQPTNIDLSQIKDVARAKAEEGLALYAESKWAEAYERFKLAEDLFHAPTLVLYMAHCKRELGALRESRELYRKVADEPIPGDAPEAFIGARDEARQQIAALDASIPRITIEVTGVAVEARVALDGAVVAPRTELELDPGRHHIHATAAGAEAIDLDLDLVPGTRATIPLAFERVAPPPPRPPSVPFTPPPSEPAPGSLVPGFIAYGVSAAGLLIGAVAGGIAVSRVEAIKEECNGITCPDRLQADADEAQTISTVSNVGFVIAGVGLIVGTVLVIVRPGGESAVSLGPASAAFRVTF